MALHYEAGKRLSRHDDLDGYLTGIFGERYAEYRKHWNQTLEKDVLHRPCPPHPLHMVIEVADCCNLRCTFCIRTVLEQRTSGAMMPAEVFSRLMTEASELGVYSIALSTGEPLTHPEIGTLLAAIPGKGFHDVFLYTNGLLMKKDLLPQILDSVTRLHVSVDAIDAAMYKARRGGDWNTLMRNVDAFLEERERRNLKVPLLWVSYVVTDDNQDKMEEFRRQWLDRADMIDFQRWKDYRRFLKAPVEPPSEPPAESFCVQPFRQLKIMAGGTTLPCVSPFSEHYSLGVFPDVPLKKLWESEKAVRLRQSLSAGNLLPFCKPCLCARDDVVIQKIAD